MDFSGLLQGMSTNGRFCFNKLFRMIENVQKVEIRQVSIAEAMQNMASDAYLSMGEDMVVVDDVSLSTAPHLPIQLGFFLIVLCTDGGTDFTISGRRQRMEKGDLLISIGEQIIWENTSPDDFHAKAVFLSRNFTENSIEGLSKMWPYLLHLLDHPVQRLTPDEQMWVLDCYQLICRRLNRPAGKYMREATISLTRAFFFELCNLLDKRVSETLTEVKSRAYAIFDKFIRLVSEHFRMERSVEWYSDQLNITPKHLSEAVKRVSGKTAGQWISTLVIIEIKMQLRYSSRSIKEIANALNFPNQSFLGKYFKNIEGISPLQYRNA